MWTRLMADLYPLLESFFVHREPTFICVEALWRLDWDLLFQEIRNYHPTTQQLSESLLTLPRLYVVSPYSLGVVQERTVDQHLLRGNQRTYVFSPGERGTPSLNIFEAKQLAILLAALQHLSELSP